MGSAPSGASASRGASVQHDEKGRALLAADRFDGAVARLGQLLHSAPDAEELATSAPELRGVKHALDDKRFFGAEGREGRVRGLPLWMAVKALKASWHEDGSWPLIGHDAAEQHGACDPQVCVANVMRVSVHPHAKIVRSAAPCGAPTSRVPCQPMAGEPVRPDPTPDEVAERYRQLAMGRGTAGAEIRRSRDC